MPDDLGFVMQSIYEVEDYLNALLAEAEFYRTWDPPTVGAPSPPPPAR